MFDTKSLRMALALASASTLIACATGNPAATIDNSAIGQAEFRAHKATYGLVYKLPQQVNDELNAKIYAPLRPRLVSTRPASRSAAIASRSVARETSSRSASSRSMGSI